MIGDRILLRPLKWEPSKILEVVRKGRPVRGEIVSIGPGHHPLKYKKDQNGQKKSFEYSKHFRPTELKVGDIVELGGLGTFDGVGYSFPEIVVGNETMLVIAERDVAGVVIPQEQGIAGHV